MTFRHDNLPHQQYEWDHYRDAEARALLWSMRTGKTKAMIDLGCHLYSTGKIGAMLVLAPNGVHSNWKTRQWPQHGWLSVPTDLHAWSSTEPDGAAAQFITRLGVVKQLSVLLMASESVALGRAAKLVKAFMSKASAMGTPVLLVVDESHNYGDFSSKRTKFVRGLARQCAYRRILTGTPTADTPLAAYSQFDLLAHGALGFTSLAQFKQAFVEYKPGYGNGRGYQVIQGYKNLALLRERIAQWSTVVRREDVAGLPELRESLVYADMPPKTREVYKAVQQQLLAWLDQGQTQQAVIAEGGVKMMRLQQIANGWTVTPDNEMPDKYHRVILDNAKLEALSKELQEELALGCKVIVWAGFKQDQEAIARLLREELKVPFVEYHGSIAQAERAVAIDQFNNNPECMVFLGHPRSGGIGLELSAADTIIWYGPVWSNGTTMQADERASRVGKGQVRIIRLLTKNSVDEVLMSKLGKKVTDMRTMLAQCTV